jgi:hypothetical protein
MMLTNTETASYRPVSPRWCSMTNARSFRTFLGC